MLQDVYPWFIAALSVIAIVTWILKSRSAPQARRGGPAEIPADVDEPAPLAVEAAEPREDHTAGVRTKGPSFRLNVTSVEPLPGNEGLCVLRGRLKAGEPRPDDRLLSSATGTVGAAAVVKVGSEPAESGPRGPLTSLLMRGLEPGTIKVGDVVLGAPRLLPAESFPQAKLISGPAPVPPMAVEILALACPHCGKGLRVKSAAVGRVVHCLACKQPFQVER